MKISIITINYNDREGLARTFQSVRRQTCSEFEYVVVDGGSSDGSLDLIKENSDIISLWVSEPDKGIYNAMNKGVRMATGDYCLFLNSGDYLHGAESMKIAVETPFKADIVLSKVLNHDLDGTTILYVPPKQVTFRQIYQIGIHHAGSFIKRQLMLDYPYREDLKILSDRDFFIKTIIFDNVTYEILDEIICDFEYGGASSDRKLAYDERLKILNSFLPPRLAEEYLTSNLQIMQMSATLAQCKYKIVKFICKLDLCVIKLLKAVLGKKLYHDPYL